MSVRLGQVSHVMLGVRDLARSLDFYREKLGMVIRVQIPGLIFLDGGGVMLGLSEGLGRVCEQIVGATELVFNVPDVRAAHAALPAVNIRFIREPRAVSDSLWAATFEDPDGHKLTVCGPESATQ